MTVRRILSAVLLVSIVALVALVVLNAKADWELQLSLRRDSATGELGGEASLPLFIAAQAERKATAVYLEQPTARNREALAQARAATDNGAESFRRLSGTELEKDLRHKWSSVERVYATLDTMASVRSQTDARAADRVEATSYYTGLLTDLIRFYQHLSAMDEAHLVVETRPLVGLFWAVEGLAQEDMLISAARAAGEMTAADRQEFARAYGGQRVMYESWIAPYLPAKDKALYDALVASAQWAVIQRVEAAVIGADAGGNGALEELPAEVEQWEAAYGPVAGQVAELNASRTAGLLAHGYQRADDVRTRALLQISGLLLAVIILAGLMWVLMRRISRRLRSVQARAEETVSRLPLVVARLRAGERVDPEVEFPPPAPGRGDEFTPLERALNTAQRMVVASAAKQAADRRGFESVVVLIGRRALSGVTVVLDEMTRLQHKYGRNDEVAADIAKLDHLLVSGSRTFLDSRCDLASPRRVPAGGARGGPQVRLLSRRSTAPGRATPL
ncbi:nitrate- and nitrite sensing domain-containing protein, partial [Streptomyces sp. NPDC003860]